MIASLSFPVVRPDDLFQAVFRFEGFRLDETSPARLIRETDRAVMVVELPPQAILEQAMPVEADGFIHPPAAPALAQGRRSGPSRLAFLLPAEVTELPIALDAWLEWERFELIPAVDVEDGVPEDPEPPDREATAIELPTRAILSPDRGARWMHGHELAEPGGAVELWRARLIGEPFVRVAWSPDIDDRPLPPFPTTPDPQVRRDAVTMTASLHFLDEDRFGSLDDEESLQTIAALRNQTAIPITVDRLELSTLGGTLAFRRDFAGIDLGDLIGQLEGHELNPDGVLSSLRHWSHRVRLGRDMHVRTVTGGNLFPYGHRAHLVTLGERVLDFDPQDGRELAWLVLRTVVALDQEERRYEQADLPFRSVRFPPDASVALPPAPPGQLPAFALQATATDHAGATHSFRAQLLFVPQGSPTDPFPQYAELDREAALPCAPLAFVPGPGGAYPATAIRIGAAPSGAPGGGVPVMEMARIIPDAVVAFAGTQRDAAISYAHGLASGAFAKIDPPLEVVLAAARAGGLAAPRVRLDALSQAAGVTLDLPPGVPPAELIATALGGRLLGVLDLATLIDIGPAGQSPPSFKTVGSGSARRVEFEWSPRLRPQISGATDAQLRLNGVIAEIAGRPSVTMNGVLERFKLTFADLVEFEFARLAFSSASGRPISVDTVEGTFAFTGDLAFLSQISDAFAKAAPGGGDGTKVSIDTGGVVATMALPLPELTMGQFVLMNLALNAALTLRFDGAAQVSLGVSSKRAPFLVSYNGIGGGGYFQLTSDLDKAIAIEAALEFGAVVEINLAVLGAGAQIVAGIYISLVTEQGRSVARLGGYIRVHGAVRILGIITIALDVMVRLTLQGTIATGHAEVTLMVQVFAFSRSISFSISQSFDAGGVIPGTQQTMSLPVEHRRLTPDWVTYCGAFA